MEIFEKKFKNTFLDSNVIVYELNLILRNIKKIIPSQSNEWTQARSWKF